MDVSINTSAVSILDTLLKSAHKRKLNKYQRVYILAQIPYALSIYYMVNPQSLYLGSIAIQRGAPEFAIGGWTTFIPRELKPLDLELLRSYPGSFDADHKNSPEFMFDWLTVHLCQVDTGWIDATFLNQVKPFFMDLKPENLKERYQAYRAYYLDSIAKDNLQ